MHGIPRSLFTDIKRMILRNSRVAIRPATKKDGNDFLELVDALADYEKLKRPTASAKARLIQDCFGRKKRFEAYLAFVGQMPVGYAIVFETYSSFLALPTLYLEDLFILPDYRKQGVGLQLFKYCLTAAQQRGCGRMEWVVLDWNTPAITFYRKLGARRMKQWLHYRLERDQFAEVLGRRNKR